MRYPVPANPKRRHSPNERKPELDGVPAADPGELPLRKLNRAQERRARSFARLPSLQSGENDRVQLALVIRDRLRPHIIGQEIAEEDGRTIDDDVHIYFFMPLRARITKWIGQPTRPSVSRNWFSR